MMKQHHSWNSMLKACAMLFVSVFCLASCYNDDEIKSDISDLRSRVTSLEEWQKSVNSDIQSIQTIVEALQKQNYITAVTPFSGGGDTGYTIAFNSGETINIRNGKDGKDGTDGKSPDLSVKEDIDGVYYWTVNGNFLTDAAGKKMPVTGPKGEKGDKGDQGDKGDNGDKGETGAQGEKGQTGETGAQGESGTSGNHAIAPKLQISDSNVWQISTDDGKTWKDMTDSQGNPVKATGKNGAQGENGAPGKDGDSFFAENNPVDVKEKYVTFTLKDGTTTFTVPRGNAITIGFTEPDYYIQGSSLDVDVELAGISDDNVSALTAEVKGADADATAVYTRAGDQIKIEITEDKDSKAHIKITNIPQTGNDYILKVKVVTKDGKETSSTTVLRALKKPDSEEKDGKTIFKVSTVAQWLWLTENYKFDDIDTIKLVNDLDFKGMTIKSLGEKQTNKWGEITYEFNSCFDGCGHTIKNFVIKSTDNDYAGLFSYSQGWKNSNFAWTTIKNLTIENAIVTGKKRVGIVTGGFHHRGIIDNVTVKNSKAEATDNSDIYVGGICGIMEQGGSEEEQKYVIANCHVEDCILTGKNTKNIHEILGVLGINKTELDDDLKGKYSSWDEGSTFKNVKIEVSK